MEDKMKVHMEQLADSLGGTLNTEGPVPVIEGVKLPKKFVQRLDEDEWVDEIRFTTVPRFKMSEMSGDEWRYSVHVQLIRKGHVLKERSFGNMNWAVEFLGSMMGDLGDEGRTWDDDLYCMQPGCSELATVQFKKLKNGCSHCGHVEERSYGEAYRRFCDKHKERGDSDLDDNDGNYEIVPFPLP